MNQPTAQDIFDNFEAIQSVVFNYGEILRSKKAPSVIYEENRTKLRTRFANAMALFQAAQTELQHLSQEELMVQLGGQIRDLDKDFKDHCVTYNRNWELTLKEVMDELRSQLAPLLHLPNPLQNQNTTGVEAGTQTEQRTHDSEAGTQTEERENDSDAVEETAGGNTSNDPQPDQHETTMDESVEGNPPDNPVLEPSPLAEIEVEQGPTFDDAEDDMEANGADHDTSHTAEDVTVNRGDATNPEEDHDETMRDAQAENDNESSSSDSSDSSDSDDEPIVSQPPSRQQVSSRTAGGSIEVLQTPVRQTRSSMARMSSPRATRSSKQKEPLQNKRRASNASPPPTRSKRLRGGAETAKKTNESPRQARPTPRESNKPTESPAGGPSRNTTRELPQKRGNKPVESSTRAPRRRSQRYIVESGENGEFEGVLKPIPGKVYATYWEKIKSFLAVIALPMGDFSSIGFEGSIDSCDLTENPCYTKNRKGEYTLARGYRDGEELEKERIFPILYFDGNPFPHHSAIGWCAGKDLREFKDEHQLVPYMKTVRQYLQSRGFTEDTQDSEAEPARTRLVAQEESEAEPARSESVAREIQVAGSDDDYAEPSDPDTDPEDLDATDDAEEDVDMADGITEEPSNTRQRNQQKRADRREEDRPDNETSEHERPAEPAETPQHVPLMNRLLRHLPWMSPSSASM
ncbi:uncharacterized protein B0J16DRAFT_122997 [Fusarium flagelliforme]|uniref:uncharacterized protein n=1 Tax=Fusarium flagelliforme TaxID=2675880 RepID=UPI001E8D2191|nr:uncharacterized protein B0J16DRAFT_122997 [Fusarium flagelliforme]KAH7184859.1 hypothetical protein B0J16DRAFT_122997 [Fusarium flagelliforme]